MRTNNGNFIISLGQLTPWLAQQAESARCRCVLPGFAAAAPLFIDDVGCGSRACASAIWGSEKDGTHGPNYTPGVGNPRAAPRCSPRAARGSVSQGAHQAALSSHAGHDPQTYAASDSKELWQLPAGRVQAGSSFSIRVGWPVDRKTYGGSFLYHLDNDRVYVGYVAGLDYADPRFKPFEAFQQFKSHPSVQPLLEGGEILAAGARTIASGGWQSLPTLEMPGALLIGDAGGTLNFPKIKGIHQAIRSGTLAAEHIAETRHGAPDLIRALACASTGGRRSYAQSAQYRAGHEARTVVWPGQRRMGNLCDARQVALDLEEQGRLVEAQTAG